MTLELDNDPTDTNDSDLNDSDPSLDDGGEGNPPLETDPPVPAHADPAPIVTQPPQQPEPKVLQVPSSTMKRIKEEARQKGREALTAELNAEARKLGFATHADMVRSIATNRRPGAKPQGQQPASSEPSNEPRESPRKLNALEREVQRLTEERKRQNRRVAELEKENKRLKAAIDEKEAEIALRVSAAKNGVQDIEYALHVLRQHLRGKSEQELSSFSEEKFFSDILRTSHPYLYGVETRPANSSPAPATPPSPPAAPRNEGPRETNFDGPVDAKKLSPQEYQELLRKRGITDPSIASFAG